MRIGIDIRSTLKRKTGIGNYTFNLLKALAKIDKDNLYFLYSKKSLFNCTKRLLSLPGDNFYHKVNRFNLSPKLFMRGLDVFHSSSFDLPKINCKKFILTIHDLIIKSYPQGHSQETIEMTDKLLKRVLVYVDKIITVSIHTKEDLVKWYDVNPEKINVIYPGINENFYQIHTDRESLYELLEKKYNVPKHYILYVGTVEPRKNVIGLIKAFKELKETHKMEHKLVIVGMRGWMCSDVFKLAEKLKLKEDVVFTGYVKTEDINIIYNLADLFVYPSFYEGFGFPIVEAFKCGTAVVTSNSSSMKEIAGEAAVLIDPADVENIADGIWSILSNTILKDNLIKKGLKRAKDFSWEKTAKKMLEVFTKCRTY